MHVSCDPHSLQQLIDYDTEVSWVLLEQPIKSLEVFDDSVKDVENELLDRQDNDLGHLSFKNSVHVRLCNPPMWPELSRHTVPTTCDVGRLLAFSGVIM